MDIVIQIDAVQALQRTGLFAFQEESLSELEQHAAELAETGAMTPEEIDALVAHDCVGAAELALMEQVGTGRAIEPPITVQSAHLALAILKYDCTAIYCPGQEASASRYTLDRITLLSGDAEKIATLAGPGHELASAQALHELVRRIEESYRTHPTGMFRAFGAGLGLRMQGVLWRVQLTIDKRPGFPGPLSTACLDTARELGLTEDHSGQPSTRDGESGPVEQDKFDVILQDAGDQTVQVIKEVRTLTALKHREAKKLVESTPQRLLHGVNKETADRAQAQLAALGASVEVR
ncbi:ribosomal protein L7/L12 [Streptomyces sp. NBC_01443]|uniref:ribosomal protein bL12 n=1 Tax=Streptomyces sp. NBC_01443 TaxID=2903868 RepID=UPI00224F6199|nr:ribosomal protein L7/L12 [Streptomyces sp. NBC_01443]MCX4626043.1 ribosomal protein L7/L12 [Streptomyces sp. NBC_01443]